MSGYEGMISGAAKAIGGAKDSMASAAGSQGGSTGNGGGYQKFMGNAQAPDMSQPQQPQMGQGQDMMSLMQMLQGGQMPRQRGRY